MNVTIVDYNSGNISSVINSFREVAENNVNIECIITKNAEKFVNILSFESLLGKKTHSNLFTLDEENPQFLYIYTFTDDFVYQIWRVTNKSMSNCLDPNNLIPLNKPFKACLEPENSLPAIG